VRLAGVSALALCVAAGCHPLGGDGRLTARWTAPGDTSTATLTAPVTGRWCVGPDRLDIRAVAGDTGLGLVIYPSDSSAMHGEYTVLSPERRLQVRPSAAVALRWVGKVMVQGWWGDSGSVTLAGGPVRGLSGRGAARLVSGLDPDSVTTLAFEFSGVRVRNDTLCDAPDRPAPDPTDSTGSPPPPGVN
jgi:hypothetical protein